MKLTHKEHEARAMLLGRVYDWRDGTYCLVVDGNMVSRDMICASSLEPLRYSKSVDRREQWDTMDEKYGGHPEKETPVARMDEE